ncbi:hypothetical protein J2125_004566 [Erwinia toletana]|uniref:Uncharacterized protein n=1 Tax=Winslowiella toletana TaxID=92490 RepID=A0ABS4PFE5_9GAMM|nr:hypothetical protein [Winslowiella toletana]MBP2171374.1 hypothetical protein [Winslowiella toletana]
MTKLKKNLIFVASALIYFFMLPEILFKHLSDDGYHFVAGLTNPFNIFGSDANSLIVTLIIMPLLFAWLTVTVFNRIFSKK